MDQPQRNRYDDCDVIFRIGNRSFMACREVLIQKVKYFQSMFTLDMKEKNEFIVHLDPEIISPHVFDAILNFIYSSTINISVDNVKALYRAADFLCFTELSDKIIKYLNSNMVIENISTFMDLAKTYKLTTLEEDCRKCIIANPKNLSNNGSGLVDHLNYDELTTILRDANLEADTKFEYVMKWIRLDETGGRQEKLMDLLRLVQLQEMSSKILQSSVASNGLILENFDALLFVFRAIINKARTLEYTARDRKEQISYLERKIFKMQSRLHRAGIRDEFD